MNKAYRQQVELLLKIIPTLSGIEDFAVHGGTAINLYILDLPRYSVDIDVTYIPVKPREESFTEIHSNLALLKEKIKEGIIKLARKLNPNIQIYQMKVNPDAFKLDFCEIEVAIPYVCL
ncbi:MAG: nucleotidyl transferase AbiEii/AbiGii toxin family protein [Cytophagaceae bacterium]|jgi:predicted nucleotidyltransferase component of viral defense system|nr:nucleotidyl transferase AbiEii/AbiGii toxin family protein [Cytophagaceae bacterium]